MKKDGIGNYFLSVIRGWDIIKRMNWNTERRANQALEIYVDSCGKKSLGETPQCFSTRRLTSSPRKAEYISRAGIRSYIVRILLIHKSFCPASFLCHKLTLFSQAVVQTNRSNIPI